MNSAETDLKVFWIRADQRWKSLRRQPGVIGCSLLDWLGGAVGRWNSAKTLFDPWLTCVFLTRTNYLKISEQRWFSSEQRRKRKFSEQKNQRWIRAVSALIFSETELIFSDTALKNQKSRARKISSESVLFQRWFSLKKSWYPLKPS